MLKLLEQLAKLAAALALVYAALQILQSIFGGASALTIELFTNKIKNETYKKISTGIENAVAQKGSLDSFKKETKLNNFNKELFDKLVEDRNVGGKKLNKLDIKLVFAKMGKDKVMSSLQ